MTREEDVAVSEAERYRILVDAIADYAIYMLDPAGMVSSWNGGAERIKGYRPGEIIGRHFSQFYTPEDQGLRRLVDNATQGARRGGR